MPNTYAVSAVLFDRDGTLIVNVPHNADPDAVVAMPTARAALDALRHAGVPTAVVSNQSVIGRGLATAAQVEATNARVEELLGPLGQFHICPHAPYEGCDCRKPRPGLVHRAAQALGVDVTGCVVIGDMPSDVQAAHAAGARAILVPSADTPEFVQDSVLTAATLAAAVETLRKVGG